MVLRFLESWDVATTGALLAVGRWTIANGSSYATGRTGKGWQLADNTLNKTLDNQATWIVGCAFRPASASDFTVFALRDGGTIQVDVRRLSSGAVQITRNGTQLAVSATGLVSQNAWSHIGLAVTINDTTGSYTVYLNGASLLTATGVDTQATANAYANQLHITVPGGGATAQWDDLFLFDGTGSYNTTFPGDCKVEALLPGGAGATTAWTPSTGSNYACVDEVPPTDDTDYVSSSTATQTDTYALGNLTTTSGTVHAVQAAVYARKDDAGTREIAPVLRPSSTDRVGTTVALSTSYAYYLQRYDRDPDDSSAWSISKLNALEAGEQCIS